MYELLHAVLVEIEGVQVTPLRVFFVLIGGLSGWALAVLLLALTRRGRTDDELPWWFMPRTVQVTLAALGLALGLDRAGLITVDALSRALGSVLRFRLYDIGDTPLTPATVLTVALIVVASYWVSRGMQRAITVALHDRGLKDEGNIAVILRLAHYAIVVVGVLVGLNTAGIKLGPLLAAGAVFAVGIGLALQSLAQNFVSGIILLVEGSIHPGDVLEVEGELVRVRRMGIRSTVVRTLDDEDLIVPNSVLVQQSVRNLTLLDNECRIRVGVGVHYESDLDLVFRTLRRAGREFPRRTEREPQVFLRDFGASSVDFELAVWTRDPWSKVGLQSQLRLAVWNALHRAGVVIAYPQIDVHFDTPVARGIASIGNGGADGATLSAEPPTEEVMAHAAQPVPERWVAHVHDAARAGSGRDRLDFLSVEPLVTGVRQVGPQVEFSFTCPETGDTVTSRVALAGAAAPPPPRNALTPVLRRVLGVPPKAVAVPADLDALLASEQGRDAAVRAFREVLSQFVWDPGEGRWVGHLASMDLLSPFERYLAEAPVRDEADRHIAMRILAAVASADGEVEDEERAFFAEFAGEEVDLDAIVNGPPLGAEDLAGASRGTVRETMLLLGCALAMADATFETAERERLDQIADGLELTKVARQNVARTARLFVFEQALDAIREDHPQEAAFKLECRAFARRLALSREDAEATESRWRRRRGVAPA